jgi:anti-sigma factor RsiW
MEACEPNLLSSFVDGELAPAERDRIAAHVAVCASCAAEVQALRELSHAFAAYRFDALKPAELASLHRQFDEQVDAPIWRLGGALGLIAASILVVAATWLAAIPTPGTRRSNPAVAARPAEWELVASTLRVEVPGEPQQLDQWMLDQLALAEGPLP